MWIIANNIRAKNWRHTPTNMIYQWFGATIQLSIENGFRVNALKGVPLSKFCIALTFSIPSKSVLTNTFRWHYHEMFMGLCGFHCALVQLITVPFSLWITGGMANCSPYFTIGNVSSAIRTWTEKTMYFWYSDSFETSNQLVKCITNL